MRNKPVFKKGQPDDAYKFKPLPLPTGSYPYRLTLEQVKSFQDADEMVFHMVGDTGSVRNPDFQRLVASEMAKQYDADVSSGDSKIQFLYHLGDIVYNFGEAGNYQAQFFEPYKSYPGPIFAIAGNHDGDVNPGIHPPYESLDAFRSVFCDSESRSIPFALNEDQLSRKQPNVYWTLQTPLATIIGLYSNVPKYGGIDDTQRDWLVEELKAANVGRHEKALIVCVHHAPYSADINHGSSLPIITIMHDAFEKSGVRPDIVFSGHVHSYQRFHKHFQDGTLVPFIVAGAGGYDELHAIAPPGDENFTDQSSLFSQVSLENYCDNRHGFLKITLKKKSSGLILTGEYYTMPSKGQTISTVEIADHFSFNL